METTPSHSVDTPAAGAQVAEPVSMKEHAIPAHIETVVTPSSSPNLVQVSEQSVSGHSIRENRVLFHLYFQSYAN